MHRARAIAAWARMNAARRLRMPPGERGGWTDTVPLQSILDQADALDNP